MKSRTHTHRPSPGRPAQGQDPFPVTLVLRTASGDHGTSGGQQEKGRVRACLAKRRGQVPDSGKSSFSAEHRVGGESSCRQNTCSFHLPNTKLGSGDSPIQCLSAVPCVRCLGKCWNNTGRGSRAWLRLESSQPCSPSLLPALAGVREQGLLPPQVWAQSCWG